MPNANLPTIRRAGLCWGYGIGALLLALCLGGCQGDRSDGASARGAAEDYRVGTPARFLRAQGQPVPVYESFEQLEDLFQHQNDTTYVINFWATWCKPCIEEMPYFERLHDQLAGEKLRVVLVNLDFEEALDDKLVPFLEANQLRSEVLVLLDGNYNAWIDRVSPSWTGALPVTLVYRGEERLVHNDQFDEYEELETMVREIL